MKAARRWVLLAAALACAADVVACGVPRTLPPTPVTPAPAPTARSAASPAPTAQPAFVPPTPTTAVSPSGAWAEEFRFEQVVTVGDQSTPTARMAYKKGKMRLEVWALGDWAVYVDNPDRQVAYMWHTGQNRALKLPLEQFEEQKGMVPDPRALFSDAVAGELTGSDTIDGKLCDVYEVAGSASSVKSWVWRETGFPLRWEIVSPDGTIRADLRNVQLGGIPDSLFELPPGMQVTETTGSPS